MVHQELQAHSKQPRKTNSELRPIESQPGNQNPSTVSKPNHPPDRSDGATPSHDSGSPTHTLSAQHKSTDFQQSTMSFDAVPPSIGKHHAARFPPNSNRDQSSFMPSSLSDALLGLEGIMDCYAHHIFGSFFDQRSISKKSQILLSRLQKYHLLESIAKLPKSCNIIQNEKGKIKGGKKA